MTSRAVRLHAFSTGSMTSALGGFLEGEEGDVTYPVPMFVVEHPDGLIAVDAGLHPDLANDSSRLGPLDGVFRVHLPADGTGTAGALLGAAGFDPSDVAQVVLTHLHFDHVGGLVDFPNARLVVQRREWAARNDDRMVDSGAYNPDDIGHGHKRVEIDGDHDLFGDGTVTCLLTDGHTAGHQSVRVQTVTGAVVLCGDCCSLRRSLVDQHLPPLGFDRRRQLVAIRRMAVEATRGATLIFGHDPDQWDTFERRARARSSRIGRGGEI